VWPVLHPYERLGQRPPQSVEALALVLLLHPAVVWRRLAAV
jgi:hypothetical protein